MQGNSYQRGLVALKAGKVQLAKELFTVSNDSRAKNQLTRLEKRKSEQMISACIITKNNQATIEECLASLYKYNVEIVIADLVRLTRRLSLHSNLLIKSIILTG